ncbi:hypothetical protein Glove_130g197 [Diversispora epigaea]|uniref:Uncharacterized protein n=1 Tax=Diversispora epigaea TaxID=1348612 RepID=A0A397J7M7_9GLOM|nr:hypothetical protein Glove_130g197 [Diversispora epigaea]
MCSYNESKACARIIFIHSKDNNKVSKVFKGAKVFSPYTRGTLHRNKKGGYCKQSIEIKSSPTNVSTPKYSVICIKDSTTLHSSRNKFLRVIDNKDSFGISRRKRTIDPALSNNGFRGDSKRTATNQSKKKEGKTKYCFPDGNENHRAYKVSQFNNGYEKENNYL